jgi:hypothetical protein
VQKTLESVTVTTLGAGKKEKKRTISAGRTRIAGYKQREVRGRIWKLNSPRKSPFEKPFENLIKKETCHAVDTWWREF